MDVYKLDIKSRKKKKNIYIYIYIFKACESSKKKS